MLSAGWSRTESARASLRRLGVAAMLAFIAFHTLYVVMRVAPFRVPRIPAFLTAFWESYGALTGASSGYSFFAPAVASQLVVTAEWLEPDGTPKREVRDGSAKESELRVTALFLAMQQMDVTELSARAMAADVLRRHTEAESVTLSVALHMVPTMAEYRAGARPEDRPFYRAVFARRDDLPKLLGAATP